jgi:hypothetical protein
VVIAQSVRPADIIPEGIGAAGANHDHMLLRNRAPGINDTPAATPPHPPFEHLPESAIAVLRWLNVNRVDYVLVGSVARAVRGDNSQTGPVSIVPAPYGRNLDRLARALWSAKAKLRVDGQLAGPSPDSTVAIRVSAEKLVREERWTLRCGEHDLDVEGRHAGSPRYQELLYEAARMTLADDVTVEVAAPEDIEHYDHMRRTGRPPEMTVRRLTADVEPS